jgi:hypothetical protein
MLFNNNQDYAGIDKSKGEDLVFTVPTITAACAANPACASATAAGIVYVGSKIAEPVAEAVSAVGDAIADGVVIAVDAVQDALNKTTEDESEESLYFLSSTQKTSIVNLKTLVLMAQFSVFY